MTMISLFSLTIALLVLAASPGPGVFATVALSIKFGVRAAAALIMGIVIGDLIYLLFAVWGVSLLARELGEFFIIAKVFGGGYLFWLGIKMWFSKPQNIGDEKPQTSHLHSKNTISGLVVTLSNPKAILFYCGFLPTFINLSKLTPIDIMVISGVVAIVIGGVLLFYAYLASHAQYFFSGTFAARRLNRAAGGVMMTAGIAIVTE